MGLGFSLCQALPWMLGHGDWVPRVNVPREQDGITLHFNLASEVT